MDTRALEAWLELLFQTVGIFGTWTGALQGLEPGPSRDLNRGPPGTWTGALQLWCQAFNNTDAAHIGWVRGLVVGVPDLWSEGCEFESWLLGFWLIALDKLFTPKSLCSPSS